ncbi:MAG: TAT-variant-translocated molybdopterin oxidoreductase [Cryomorphaceae bacterium]|nr:TAT-variant-translocated molybdopterin oxidoreductase [Cryomorphaceae bacterium]
MASDKTYWKGIGELENPEMVEKLSSNEFPDEIPVEDFLTQQESQSSNTSRRDFLKFLGFSTAAATLAACEAPVIESIPYVVAPDKLVPGIASYYATTFDDGYDFASVLVKTREGRPIKFEPNKDAKYAGSINARVQASVLNLYDSTRLKDPVNNGEYSEWAPVDNGIKEGLEKAAASGKRIVVLSSSINSPSSKKVIKAFSEAYPNVSHVTVDAFSYSNALDASAEVFGVRAFPYFKFKKAAHIVSVGGDFLGDWIGQAVSADYATRRKPGKDMSRHIQIEANLSLTGSNSDIRHRVKPSEYGAVLAGIYNRIASATGNSSVSAPKSSIDAQLDAIANDLMEAKGQSLVICGGNDRNNWLLTYGINQMLGNFGKTIKHQKRNNLRQGNDKSFNSLLADMEAGRVGALFMVQTNPVYQSAQGQTFAKALEKVDCSVSFSDKFDETANLCKFVAAAHHPLESWNDSEPFTGYYSFMQPAIRPLFNTRQWQYCLLKWSGNDSDYQAFLKNNWSGREGISTDALFHDGYYTEKKEYDSETEPNAMTAMSSVKVAKPGEDTELVFYTKTGMGIGNLSNNPWLQELPDPISRVSWDNYLTISAAQAADLGLKNKNRSNGALDGSLVTLKHGDTTIENVPVLIQPGQAYGTVGLAVGYGRNGVGKAGDNVGVNAFAMMKAGMHSIGGVKIEQQDGWHQFACVQLHHTMMGRRIVQEITLDKFLNDPSATENGKGWNERTQFETIGEKLTSDKANLWSDFDHETGHFWNMSIDLNTCTGCGACVIACHAENNVPVVGKEEIRMSRDMHWLRIDRYYSSDMTKEKAAEEGVGSRKMYKAMEDPSASPEVVFQPVMCQHCNHAPCETVCPVAATVHSTEGLNHMAYNRCIGTRYCANNCPYKVRRFNWFLYTDNPDHFGVNYALNDDLGKMVLNPDVTVRTRGVMEKCSFCIQRIQLGKLEAKKEGRKVKDGDVQTACMQACDTGAIQFGDVNDPESKIAALKSDKRMYHLLEDVGTQPSVFYQTKVRNKNA